MQPICHAGQPGRKLLQLAWTERARQALELLLVYPDRVQHSGDLPQEDLELCGAVLQQSRKLDACDDQDGKSPATIPCTAIKLRIMPSQLGSR